MNSIKQFMAKLTDRTLPLIVPREIIKHDTGGDPYFLLEHNQFRWKWYFVDEYGSTRIESCRGFETLADAMNHIRETQKRIGNLTTPILRVV